MPISGAAHVYRQVALLGLPTVLIWGKNDKITPIETANRILKDLPNANLHLLDAGHLPQFEVPDQTNKLLIDFIKRKAL